jgi:hypothetical protein
MAKREHLSNVDATSHSDKTLEGMITPKGKIPQVRENLFIIQRQ